MIRTRFAPSPTGFLHIGGLRTALYNYLFARKNKGTFILRIEDTDQKRYMEGAVESLLNILKQVGLEFDEGPNKNGEFGPYIQSQRTEIYRKYARELLNKKAAYHCFCSAEKLKTMRNKQHELKKAPMYDRTCLGLSVEEIDQKKTEGSPFVIRQKIPHGRLLKFADLIRGKISFETATIDDQILMKSDNFPTYHLANVVDDHLMGITHVIRGEEWLPSTPKHILLYEAFGWSQPEFGHIPLLLNKDKTKLSKRQGDVSVEDYLQKGYSKEALINFIALLGWHPGKGEQREIFSLTELIEKFSLENVHKAGAIFDVEKLNWFNFQWQKKTHHEKLDRIAKTLDKAVRLTTNKKNEPIYVFESPNAETAFLQKRGELLVTLCQKYLPGNYLQQQDLLLKALVTIEEKVLKEPWQASMYLGFYFEPKDFSKDLILNAKMQVDETVAQKALKESANSLTKLEHYENIGRIEQQMLELVKKLGLTNGQILWPLRVALSGEQFSPGVFEIIWTLGKEASLQRIKKALKKFAG